MLIGAGCSLTYGSELEGVGVSFHTKQNESFSKTFIAKIANTLNKDYAIVAIPGASNKSIARAVLPYLYKKEVTVIIVCWTWIERINIGTRCLTQPGLKKYHKGIYEDSTITQAMYEVYENTMLGFENQIESLEAYYLVNSQAKANNKTIYNVNMGSFLDAIIPYDDKILPNDFWNHVGGSNFQKHPYWDMVKQCNNLFNKRALHYTITSEAKIDGYGHFTEYGHKVCADMILFEMNNDPNKL